MSILSYPPRRVGPGIQRFAIAVLCATAQIGSIVYADWESDANARIEQIRKRSARITVVDSLGNPVPNLNVQIDQVKHRFGFGTALTSGQVTSTNHQSFIRDHFEWAVCENDMKWSANEGTRDVWNFSNADTIATWCANNDIFLRGHTLIWETGNQTPSWVPGLACSTYPATSEMLEEIDERINYTVNRYAGQIVQWDINNEMLSGNEYDCLGEAGRAHMFNLANSIDPDCLMMMNEYAGNSFGGYDGWSYRDRANNLISLGAAVEGLGIQAHVGSPFDPGRYYSDVLEPLAQVGLPIMATEFDTDAGTEAQAANDLENLYRICFSHPNVEGVIMWGYDQNVWRGNGIVNSSTWTLNAAGVRYEALLDEWTTTGFGIVDQSGNTDFRGFHGTYEITLSAPGQTSEVYTIVLDPGTGTASFQIETALVSPPPDTTAPAAPTGLIAHAGEGKVTLDWDDNAEEDLSGYTVYRSLASGSGYGTVSADVAASNYVDTAVSNGTTYYYIVTAHDFSSNESGNSNEASATPDLGAGQDPYPGPAAHAIPGRIEAENYDLGGEGLAFHDTDSTNQGNAYRTDGVDVEVCGEGGYNVGWIFTGEWLEYTVDVAATGAYDIELRVASDSSGGVLHIEFDGNDVTGTVNFASTGGWQTYTSIYVNDVSLTEGLHVLRISMDSTYFNINWLDFTTIPYGDFTGDYIVNSNDFPGFFDLWLSSDCGELDLNGDCVINLYEFAELAKNWLDDSFQ